MTTKRKTSEAKKTTTVVKEATTKRPTVKQLQEQYAAAVITIENLGNIIDKRQASNPI